MGDVTAQAYEGRAVAQVDWGRTVRSAAIGAFAHGPLSHFVFSSKGSFIDKVVERVAVGLASGLHILRLVLVHVEHRQPGLRILQALSV